MPLSLASGQTALAQVDRELVRGAHAVLEHGVVDVDTAYLLRVARQPVPDVLDPENGEPGLIREPAPQIVELPQIRARRIREPQGEVDFPLVPRHRFVVAREVIALVSGLSRRTALFGLVPVVQ